MKQDQNRQKERKEENHHTPPVEMKDMLQANKCFSVESFVPPCLLNRQIVKTCWTSSESSSLMIIEDCMPVDDHARC